MYLGEPPFDRHGLAVRAGGHVTASQNAGQYTRRRIKLAAQDVGESAFAGFDDGAGVMSDQPAQHGIGVLGVAQVPGAIELVQAGGGEAGGVADPAASRAREARGAEAGATADGGTAGGSQPGGPADPAGPAVPPAPRPDQGVVQAGFAGRVTLTVPLATALDLAGRPGEIPGIGPVDPWLARDLAAAAAENPRTTWCVTVTDEHGHAIGHGCARPEPASRHGPGPPGGGTGSRDGPGFAFALAGRDGPPGGYGTWRLRTPGPGPGLIVTLDPIGTDPCEHRFQASGHDPGVKLRHLSEVRHATCTAPACRRPAATCDFEHNVPYEAGGLSCLCNGGPKCRHDHRLKQHPDGTSISSPMVPSPGPPRPAVSTPPNPRGTPSDRVLWTVIRISAQ